MSTPERIFTPEEAAAWLGMTPAALEKSNFRRARLGRGIVRYLSSLLEEDIAAAPFIGPRANPFTVDLEAEPPTQPPAPKPRARRRPSLWVYVIRARPSGKLKIGQAVDVEKRIAGLQTGTWEGLDLLLTIPDDRNLERELHERFADDRIMGEWFEPSPAIMAWLRERGATL